jgi:anti-sigma factor RsiW
MNEALRHLDDEHLLLSLYGAAAPETAAHLEGCAECAARLRNLEARRSAWLAAPAPPADAPRLRAQREAVYRAIEQDRRRPYWRALQAGVLACSVLLAVLLYRPAPPPVESAGNQAISDQQLYNDLAEMMNRDTPAAAEPLMALFAPQQSQESQQP